MRRSSLCVNLLVFLEWTNQGPPTRARTAGPCDSMVLGERQRRYERPPRHDPNRHGPPSSCSDDQAPIRCYLPEDGKPNPNCTRWSNFRSPWVLTKAKPRITLVDSVPRGAWGVRGWTEVSSIGV